ncbi:N-acetylmuramoyl-l-alanine amidase I [Mycobacteroides franklinii]|uniref:N-acetylmuramoyl-l-alanine amidase I n=2 Tax=Mycobacteroides franklinii TaxID=948102 RepID=A0A4R8QU09_9MYCO|nr:N-acetylmuramoyl-l-alanine amidase I [Mycobacteroides franklinii]TDZ47465.1 N-acetylmuramoyl-l-alanine amidase I [Mycobacteroides franklinii]TDZ58199.1 N-acetylmuramoyl-l-alanine amidase I [Mycobacteroides franklinii]TDZ61223.1 N-acetylmuramoyl-l-alanine amidase I [Mycobacteroides franklinii]TDZ71538.1 N-acetylmuramoyl-l-alanine amidase I [Mycobacteroides franklinii]
MADIKLVTLAGPRRVVNKGSRRPGYRGQVRVSFGRQMSWALPLRRALGLSGTALLTAASVTVLPIVASSAPTIVTAGAAPGVAGRIVVLDPGHNGANDGSINNQVPDGRGGTKSCQTSGTATDGGYPEHTFTWNTVLLIRQQLTQLGVRTAMTRGDDNKLAACIDKRAEIENGYNPDAVVSIHADGGPAGGHGFHVNYSSPPVNAVQGEPTLRFAKTMRDSLQAAGLTPATYIGTGGLYGRSDLAGLNLAQHPKVLVELGNMKNAQDAAMMTSPEGRSKYAQAVVQGIVAYLSGTAPAAEPAPAPEAAPGG